MKLLLLILFSISFLFSKNINSLSKSKEWKILLHIKDIKSEIDDENFFLTPTRLPEEELVAIKKELLSNPAIYCKFPARSNFVVEHLIKNFDKPKCKKLDEYLAYIKGESVTLVFPAGYINSPASMYGHTLLRIDTDASLPLMSTAINYAANSGEADGFSFAYKGLTGKYNGVYDILRYYKKINEYGFLEKRDIWEYKLNLTEKETKRLMLHIYEVKDTSSKYYFFNKNCSYEILWFLEYARTSLNLVKYFNYKSLPIDTLKIIKQNDLISSTKFRPSHFKINLHKFNDLKNKKLAHEFFGNHNFLLLENLQKSNKIDILNLAVYKLKTKRSKNKIDKKSYTKKLIKLLTYRSKITNNKTSKNIIKPINPILTHKSAKVVLGYSNNEKFLFKIKPALHDIYDIDYGFTSGAFISFGELSLRYNKKLSFDYFNLIDIQSFVYDQLFYKPLSWKVKLGFEKIYDNSNNLVVDSSWGYTFGDTHKYFYGMISPKVLYKDKLKFSIGIDTGFIISNKTNKFGISYKKNRFNNSHIITKTELFSTFKISDQTSINFKFNRNNKSNNISTNIFYYF